MTSILSPVRFWLRDAFGRRKKRQPSARCFRPHVEEMEERVVLDAALVNQLIHQSAVLDYPDTSITVSLGGRHVDISKSVIVGSNSSLADWPSNALVRYEFVDQDSNAATAEAVRVVRGGDGGYALSGTVETNFTVVEFFSGVTVEHRSATFAASANQVDLTLATTAPSNRSFVMLSTSSTAPQANQDEQWAVRGELVDAGGTLRLRRSETGSATTVNAQIVTFDSDSGASVQTGTVVLNNGTATVGYTPQTGAGELLFFSNSANNAEGVEAAYRVRGSLANGQATFATASLSSVWVTYYIVSLPGAVVQSGVVSFDAETTEETDQEDGIHRRYAALNPVEINRSFAYVTASGGSSTRNETLGDTSFVAALVSGNTLRLERGDRLDAPQGAGVVGSSSLESAATAAWYVVELPMAPRPADDFVYTREDEPLTVAAADLFANDFNPYGQAFKVVTVSPVSANGGSVTLSDNGTPSNSSDDFLVYTPPTAYSGNDSFQYTVRDSLGFTNTATVFVLVSSFEICESPRIVFWDAGGDGASWNDPLNWSIDALPEMCDDVYIDTDPSVIIVHSAGSVSIHSLHSNNAINFIGALTLAADSEITKSFVVSGSVTQLGGALELTGGGEMAGTFYTASDTAAFEFSEGTFTDRGTQFSGAGVTRIGDGTGQREAVFLVPLPELPDVNSTHFENVELRFGGRIDGAGTWVQARNTLRWTGGTMKDAGTTQINFGARLVVSGDDLKALDQRNLVNYGRVQASGAIVVSNGAVITNELIGFVDLDDVFIAEGPGNPGRFVNESLVRIGSGDAVVSIDFDNNGILLANSGSVAFEGLLTQTAFLTVGSDQNVTAADFTFAGGIVAGDGSLTVQGVMDWTGGTLAGSGATTFSAGAAVTIQGTRRNPTTIDGRTIENFGAVTHTQGRLEFPAGSFVNAGEYVMVGDLIVNGAIFAPAQFTNSGVFLKSTGGGTGQVSVNFDNDGTVEVAGGTLEFLADGNHTGEFVMDTATTGIAFSRRQPARTQTFFPGSSFQGDGEVTLNDRVTFTVTQDVSLRIETFTIDEFATRAVLDGAGDLSAHRFNWNAGTIRGEGFVLVNPGDVLIINGDTTKSLIGRHINNYGTIEWHGEADVAMSESAGITNDGLAGLGEGNFKVFNDQTITKGDDEVATSQILILNGGSLEKLTPLLGSSQLDVYLVNSGGILDLHGNELTLGTDYTQEAGSTIVGAGTLRVSEKITVAGGIFVLGGGTVVTPFLSIGQDAIFAGSGTVEGNVVNAGLLEVGGLHNAGLLLIDGHYEQSASGQMHIEVGGAQAGTGFDQLNITGLAELDGRLGADLIGNFNPAIGATFKFLTFGGREGDFSDKGLELGNGLFFDIEYNANDLTFVTGQG